MMTNVARNGLVFCLTALRRNDWSTKMKTITVVGNPSKTTVPSIAAA